MKWGAAAAADVVALPGPSSLAVAASQLVRSCTESLLHLEPQLHPLSLQRGLQLGFAYFRASSSSIGKHRYRNPKYVLLFMLI